MNKLTRVQRALGGNSKIVIVAVEEKNEIMSKGSSWGHTVDFYVAPKNGSINNIDELQALMLSLIPKLDLPLKIIFVQQSLASFTLMKILAQNLFNAESLSLMRI